LYLEDELYELLGFYQKEMNFWFQRQNIQMSWLHFMVEELLKKYFSEKIISQLEQAMI